MVTAIGVENFCAGLVTAGFTAFLMSQCDKRYSAFQFALLTGGMALSRVIAVAGAGYLADHVGWQMFFMINMGLALPGMALLPLLPASGGEQTTRDEAQEPAMPHVAQMLHGEND